MYVRPKSRHRIKKSEVKRIAEEIKADLKLDVDFLLKGASIEVAEFEDYSLLLLDGEPCFFLRDDRFIPTLKGLMCFNIPLPRVVVDSGAVRFIVNGADVMGPGIVEAEDVIEVGSIVVVREECHGKPLAIGRALKAGREMPHSTGKAVKSLHYVGDKLWKLEM